MPENGSLHRVEARAGRLPPAPVSHPGWSSTRTCALAALRGGRGILLLSGPPGTGKTMLLRQLAQVLEADGFTVAVELHPDFVDLSPAEPSPDKRRILLVDEADHLDPAILPKLQARNPDGLMLVGVHFSDAWTEVLPGETLTLALAPLRAPEIAPFLNALNTEPGRPHRPITHQGVQRLAEHSGGVPRLLTRLADTSAWLAGLDGSPQICASHVEEAAQLRQGAGFDEWAPPRALPAKVPPVQEPPSPPPQDAIRAQSPPVMAGLAETFALLAAVSAEEGARADRRTVPRLLLPFALVGMAAFAGIWLWKAPSNEAPRSGGRPEGAALTAAMTETSSAASSRSAATAPARSASEREAAQPPEAPERMPSSAPDRSAADGSLAVEPAKTDDHAAIADGQAHQADSASLPSPPARGADDSVPATPAISISPEPLEPLGLAEADLPAGGEDRVPRGVEPGGSPIGVSPAPETIVAPPPAPHGEETPSRIAEAALMPSELAAPAPGRAEPPHVVPEPGGHPAGSGTVAAAPSAEAEIGQLAALVPTRPGRLPDRPAGVFPVPSPGPPTILPRRAGPTAASRREASPLATSATERCRTIAIRFQLGEEPSNADRIFLRNGCRQR